MAQVTAITILGVRTLMKSYRSNPACFRGFETSFADPFETREGRCPVWASKTARAQVLLSSQSRCVGDPRVVEGESFGKQSKQRSQKSAIWEHMGSTALSQARTLPYKASDHRRPAEDLQAFLSKLLSYSDLEPWQRGGYPN